MDVANYDLEKLVEYPGFNVPVPEEFADVSVRVDIFI